MRRVLISFGVGWFGLWMSFASVAFAQPASRPLGNENRRFFPEQLRKIQAQFVSLLNQTRAEEERAILRGLLWLTNYMKGKDAFEWVFCEYLFIVKTVHHFRRNKPLGKTLQALGTLIAKRIEKKLPLLYEKSHSEKWLFLNALPLLLRYGASQQRLLHFYKTHFPSSVAPPRTMSYAAARRAKNMEVLGDYLIESSFLHGLHQRYPRLVVRLPPDRFLHYVKQLRGLPFPYQYAKNKDHYSSQNYFLTHVIAALTLYGEEPLVLSPLTQKIWRYWEREWSTLRNKVGDFDLLAEVLFCYKLYGRGHTSKVKDGLRYLLKKQNPDGSWGSPKDLAGSHYRVIHPTWTALTALAAPNASRPIPSTRPVR
ncbi:MAG: hypothetical protein EP343_27360 [Deltaproteobacteria bacterium]|nr:MAG: hypothetical protein EP343_27360 [Deltaproteobacteria bacterium]